MNRRDFFHPRQVARTAGHVLGALDQPAPPPEQKLLRLGWRAMATGFEVVVPFGTPSATEAADDAFALLDALEARLTVYREKSCISLLNRLAAGQPVPLDGKLLRLLRLAERLHRETAGAFDITAGALIKAWGFFKGPKRVPPEEERAEVLQRVGMQHVLLQDDPRRVRYLRPGLEINLGGIGKGYALDELAERLSRRWQLRSFLVHGGYSSVLARGALPHEPRGWQVGITHPWDQTRRLALVWLRDRALGTSAATYQHLEYNGQKLGHILDPRTGWPAAGIASASVLAPTAAEADALSTAFFIQGVDFARAYCASHPGIGAILLPEGAAAPVVLGLESGEYMVVRG